MKITQNACHNISVPIDNGFTQHYVKTIKYAARVTVVAAITNYPTQHPVAAIVEQVIILITISRVEVNYLSPPRVTLLTALSARRGNDKCK